MLGWLDRFWHGLTGTVGQAVSDAVHWAMHALASVIFSVFRLVGAAWKRFAAGVDFVSDAAADFGKSVWIFTRYVIHNLIPGILKWAVRELDRLGHFIRSVSAWAVREIAKLYGWIETRIAILTAWVIRHVFMPLQDFALRLWDLLKKWGYTAWWFITHPDSLAELLIHSIVKSLERHAWELAGNLGKFVLSLILRNLRHVIMLAEDIITAVL